MKFRRGYPKKRLKQEIGVHTEVNMASSKTISKGIRIKKEVAEYFKDKPLNRYIEGLYEAIESGEIVCTEEGVYARTVVQKEENSAVDSVHTEYMNRLSVDAAPFGMSGEEFGNKLLDGVDSGAITYENGEFVAQNGDYDLSRLKEACHDKGVPIQKAIDNVTQMVRRA